VHVFKQQHVKVTEAGLEIFNVVAAQGGHKARGKILCSQVAHASSAAFFGNGTAHSLGQMGLAQTWSGIHKEGTHAAAAAAYVLGGRDGHIVAGANNKVGKRITPVGSQPIGRGAADGQCALHLHPGRGSERCCFLLAGGRAIVCREARKSRTQH